MDKMLKKDSQKEKRCFIVGTGPSLAYQDLSFLKNEFIISLNLAPLTLDLFNINPQINIVADKYQYEKYKEVFKELTYNKKTIKVIVASACENFPKELIDKNTYFFPKKLQQETPSFSENPLEEGFSRGKTVAFDAIQLAYHLGFKEVYIIGMDLGKKYNWGKNGHCYEIQKNKKFPELKFATSNETMIKRGLPGHPEYWDYISNCMKKAKENFDKKRRKIYNDVSSNLDVFEKKDILKEFGNKKKIVAFVHAKGSSSRIKNKNKKILGKKPLFLHILDTLLECYTIDEVYLDTESEEIFSMAKNRNSKKLKRDQKFASNETDGNLLLLQAAEKVNADIYIQALPTSPFIKKETIDEAVFNLIKNQEKDSLFSIYKDKLYLWDHNNNPQYDIENIPNSKDLKDTKIETMGLYMIKKDPLFKNERRIGKNPILWEISRIESIDIDNEEDFKLAEIIEKQKNEN